MSDIIGADERVRLAEEEHSRALHWLEQLQHSHAGRSPMPGETPEMFEERVHRVNAQLAEERAKAEILVEEARNRLTKATGEADQSSMVNRY